MVLFYPFSSVCVVSSDTDIALVGGLEMGNLLRFQVSQSGIPVASLAKGKVGR